MSDPRRIQVGQAPFRYQVDEFWAKFPADGLEGECVAVACDSRNRVVVFLRGPRPVQIFEPDGTFVTTWGEGQFVRPHGLTVGPEDTVYCTDDFDHCVRAFTLDGRPLWTLGTRGQPSDTGASSNDYRTITHGGPPFHYPTNLAVAPSGDLYISDGYGNARIHRFSASGQWLHSWGEPGSGPGQFHLPHGIAVDAKGMVFVADRENSRIQIFSPEGVFQEEWTNVARPCQVAIDKNGWYFVAELGYRAGRWPGTGLAEPGAVGGRVRVFDRKGKVQARWGGGDSPCAPGDFFAPHDITIDTLGNVYVAEVALSAGGAAGLVASSCHTLQKFLPL